MTNKHHTLKLADVRLIQRSHQISEEEAIEHLIAMQDGRHKTMTNEQLLKAAGVPAKPYATDPRPSSLFQLTRPLKVVPEPIVASLDQPKHPNKQNGRSNRDIIFDAIARGKSLIPEGQPPGTTKLEKE
jgi:hypothetical protein